MGELAKWRRQNWVRIGSDGKIKGECGTSKNKKNPDRCLPMSKAKNLTIKQRAATARKKKKKNKELLKLARKRKLEPKANSLFQIPSLQKFPTRND